MGWRPPGGYEALPSAVDGIRVFGPVADADAGDTSRSFRCLSCGAAITWSAGEGALHCAYCGHTEQAAGERVGRDAEARAFTLEALAAFAQGWGVARCELACTSCGAAVAVEQGDLSTSCPFCASPEVHLREPAHEAMRPRFVVPFTIEARSP